MVIKKPKQLINFSLGILLAMFCLGVLYMLLVRKLGFRSIALPVISGWVVLSILGLFSTPKFNKWLVNLLLVLVSTTVFLFLGDLILRNALASSFYYRPIERYLSPNFYMPDRLIRYMKGVNYSGDTYGDMIAMSGKFENKEERLIRLETDEFGFRNVYGKAKKPSKFLVIGDSFGAGVGSHQDSTFTSFFEGETGESVYNLSFPGYPYQVLLNLAIYYDKIAVEKNPTVIWFLFTGNDLPFPDVDPARDRLVNAIQKERISEHLETRFAPRLKARTEAYFQRSAFRKLRSQLRFRQTLETKGNPDIHVSKLPSGEGFLTHETYVESATRSSNDLKSLDDFPSFQNVIKTADWFCRSKGANLKIVLLPTKFEIYQWVFNEIPGPDCPYIESGLSEVLAEICHESGIDFYDAGPFFYEYSVELFNKSGKLTWWRDDTHLNSNGYHALTDYVRSFVLETGK